MKFIKNKIGVKDISQYLLNEIQTLCSSVVLWIPGSIGMLLRSCVYYFMFKEIKGISFIQPYVKIDHFNKIKIGKNFGCNSFSILNGIGGIDIGNDVLIGNNVTISSGLHQIDEIKGSIFSNRVKVKRIIIEDGVWVGAGASILPGVRLAKGSVVGANSVVTKDTESNCVYAGVPARKLRSRIIL
jgi:maltose O-acetyltransferase